MIMRCASSGSRVTRRSERTTAGPSVRFGTKCPSMTSTWMRSAPAASASATCSPRRAKSADRIDGASAIGVASPPRTGGELADRPGDVIRRDAGRVEQLRRLAGRGHRADGEMREAADLAGDAGGGEGGEDRGAEPALGPMVFDDAEPAAGHPDRVDQAGGVH